MNRPIYRLSPLAKLDLEDIFRSTVERWSFRQAEIYFGNIIDAFEGLADGHKIGHIVDVRDGYYRYLVGSHAIFYRHSDEGVDVIRILHQSMDTDRHLKP